MIDAVRAALLAWAERFLGGLSFNEPGLQHEAWAERRAPDIVASILSDDGVRAALAVPPSNSVCREYGHEVFCAGCDERDRDIIRRLDAASPSPKPHGPYRP